jgi:DNA ligase-1
MTKQLKPMLASQLDDLSLIQYPVYSSPKYDGIRCLIINGVALSRSLKLIPNLCIQQWVQQFTGVLEGLDGELIVGSPVAEDVFRKTTSFVMSIEKQGEFDFYAFDILVNQEAIKRLALLKVKQDSLPGNVSIVPQTLVQSKEELEEFRRSIVAEGYEGAMVKRPLGLYKYGRSSVREGLLLKLKLFSDSEFKIVGYEPKYHNTNEAITNELGRTTRSTAKDGLVALDTLGSLILETSNGSTFSCGTGFDDKLRKELWEQREELIGKYAKVKYFEVGMKDGIPRHPVFLGIRVEIDI